MTVKTEIKGREKCPHCGSGRLYPHGESKPREVLHTWSNGKRVYLELHRQRWKYTGEKCFWGLCRLEAISTQLDKEPKTRKNLGKTIDSAGGGDIV